MKVKYEDFDIIKRPGNIMFSSPHSHRQFRNGKIKAREFKTGTLSKIVSSKTKCSCIYRTAFTQTDPNYDKDSTYKSELVDFIKNNNIKLLFDIHGMKSERTEDICIGTGFGKNVVFPDFITITKRIFEEFGFKNVAIDVPFNASYPYTVSSYVAKKANISCLQIEINNRFTYKKYQTFDFEKLVSCFERIVYEASCFLDNNDL